GDGVQDEGEVGINDVIVKLIDKTTGEVIATDVTSGDGDYLFENLLGGNYTVMVDGATVPAGLKQTFDADGGNDGMSMLELADGGSNLEQDFGYIKLVQGIDIEKFTNGVDADTPDAAAEILAGDTVTWTYEVTNTGEVAFDESEIKVIDDQEGIISNIIDQGDGDSTLAAGETWVYEQTGIAQDLFTVTNTVIDFETDGLGNALPAGTIIDDEYQNLGVTISATKFGAMIFDSANPTGGDFDLATKSEGNILIISEDGDSSDPDDNAGGGVITFKLDNSVEVNSINFVDIEETGGKVLTTDADGNISTTSIPAPGDGSLQTLNINDSDVVKIEVHLVGSGAISGLDFDSIGDGIYKNIGTVVAGDVTDSDHSHYINIDRDPGIDIEKFTNGVDADTPDAAAVIAVGDTVTWTYEVTNTGNVAFDINDVVVKDDQEGLITNIVDQGDGDNTLAAGETWIYEQTGVAQNLMGSAGETTTFYLTGNSHLDGPNGNIRTFSADDISVKTSAFSRDAHGTWEEAFLGSFSTGLGVTDNVEGDGSNGLHRVDNVYLDNYVLFEFSENVVVDRTFLASVGKDSDITYWVGTVDDAFDNHNSLSDAFLDSLEFTEDNNTHSSYARWADINNGEVVGNILVIAASTSDAHPDDRFKIKKLEVQGVEGGIYQNVGTVHALEAKDYDLSHYTNPTPEPGIDIEKFVNGIDASGPDEYPELVPGDHVTFTYHVTNTGNVAFDAHDVIVTDDNGTADDTHDDFNPYQVLDGHFNVGDVNENNSLDAGETWKYAKTLTVEDLSTSHKIRIEAEDMHLSMVYVGGDDDDDGGYSNGYVREHNSYASGDDLIRVHGHEGTASTKFYGKDGNYDVLIGHYDENDGYATMDFKLNGHTVDHWTFDKNLGSHVADDHSFTTHTVEHLSLKYGDHLSFTGTVDGHEYARVDYIELIEKGDGIYENVATVEAGDVFDSDISGYVNPVNTIV
ncbi:MAG: SdrD B-like domain-containing protein, partial [Crocosphaera sp.]